MTAVTQRDRLAVVSDRLADAHDDDRVGGATPREIVIRRDVAVQASAVAGARRAVAGLRLPEDVAATVELAVSELVTNAITHAGIRPDEFLELLLTRCSNRVRVAVHDRGPGFAIPSSVSPDPSSAHGRGLLIVQALAETWGVDSGPTGCSVWCEIVVAKAAVLT